MVFRTIILNNRKCICLRTIIQLNGNQLSSSSTSSSSLLSSYLFLFFFFVFLLLLCIEYLLMHHMIWCGWSAHNRNRLELPSIYIDGEDLHILNSSLAHAVSFIACLLACFFSVVLFHSLCTHSSVFVPVACLRYIIQYKIIKKKMHLIFFCRFVPIQFCVDEQHTNLSVDDQFDQQNCWNVCRQGDQLKN